MSRAVHRLSVLDVWLQTTRLELRFFCILTGGARHWVSFDIFLAAVESPQALVFHLSAGPLLIEKFHRRIAKFLRLADRVIVSEAQLGLLLE